MNLVPKLIVFTAPSGAGKTTIVMHLLKVRPDLAFSISATTRSPRFDEINALHYYFLTAAEFRRKIDEDDFVEYEEVYENQFYGTMKSEVDRLLELNKSVLFDIDVKGAVNIKKHYGDRCLTIFVKPPNPEVLIDRLRKRRTEDDESLQKRIARAREELTYERKFDITIVNDNLETALQEAETIVATFIEQGTEGLKSINYGNGYHS